MSFYKFFSRIAGYHPVAEVNFSLTIGPKLFPKLEFFQQQNLLLLSSEIVEISHDDLVTVGQCGISTWRRTDETPFFTAIPGQNRTEKSWIPFGLNWRSNVFAVDFGVNFDRTIFCMILSNGDLSFWAFPSFRLVSNWPLTQQKGLISEGVEKSLSLAWWSNQEVILAFVNGSIVSCSIEGLRRTFVVGNYQPYSMVKSCDRGHFLVVESNKLRAFEAEKRIAFAKNSGWMGRWFKR